MKYEPGDFYQLPRGMALILGNPYEFVVLSRLLDRADENTGASFPSFRDLTQGIMCRNKAIQSIKALQELGIISIVHTPYKQNTYQIHYEVLTQLIKTSAPHELVHDMNPPSAPHELGSAPHELPLVHDMDTNDNHGNDNHKRKPVTKTRSTNAVDVTTVKDVFFSFKENARYNGIDFENEFSLMVEWYHGKRKKISLVQLACHNWLDKALLKNAGSGYQPRSSSSRDLPPRYTSPEELEAERIREEKAQEVAANE